MDCCHQNFRPFLSKDSFLVFDSLYCFFKPFYTAAEAYADIALAGAAKYASGSDKDTAVVQYRITQCIPVFVPFRDLCPHKHPHLCFGKFTFQQ